MLSKFKTFIFDCDGTIWKSSKLIAGSVEFLNYTKQTGRKVLLVTNNSTLSLEQYYEKCLQLGLPVEKSQIVCASNVTAECLYNAGVKGPLYVLGEEGLCRELGKVGIPYEGPGPELMTFAEFGPHKLNPDIQGVVCGFDFHFNYMKVMKAATYIDTLGLPYYATNDDAQFPSHGFVIPGTGTLVHAVRVASRKEPIMFGKPSKKLFDFIYSKYEIDPDLTLVVGDRLETDVAFGNLYGMSSAVVMTGITTEAVLAATRADPERKMNVPNMVFSCIMDLYKQLVEADKQSASQL